MFQKRKAIFGLLVAEKKGITLTVVLAVGAGLTFALALEYHPTIGTAQLALCVFGVFAAFGFIILAKGADFLRFMAGKWQTGAGAMTVALLLATWLYPPFRYGEYGHGHYWGSLFSSNGGTVDVQRLVLLDMIVVTLGGSAVYALRRKAGASAR